MPLVLLCGYPSSGKSLVCKQLVDYIQNKETNVHVISENELVDKEKNQIYRDSPLEKSIRSSLRAQVEKHISRDTVVILDGLNYIKGFRYELHCVVKAEKTLHCVVYMGIPKETCHKWNFEREPSGQYAEDIFNGLVMRFETPDSRHRWDSPLFTLLKGEPTPMEEIYDSLFGRQVPPPNQSTIPIPLSSGNYMSQLDSITQNVISELLEAQKTSCVGDRIRLSDASDRMELTKVYNMAELRRLKRQFITYLKMHPVEDGAKIGNMFAQFISSNTRFIQTLLLSW